LIFNPIHIALAKAFSALPDFLPSKRKFSRPSLVFEPLLSVGAKENKNQIAVDISQDTL
jgi:hypothetical protein